jgi:hypothetical protein
MLVSNMVSARAQGPFALAKPSAVAPGTVRFVPTQPTPGAKPGILPNRPCPWAKKLTEDQWQMAALLMFVSLVLAESESRV